MLDVASLAFFFSLNQIQNIYISFLKEKEEIRQRTCGINGPGKKRMLTAKLLNKSIGRSSVASTVWGPAGKY